MTVAFSDRVQSSTPTVSTSAFTITEFDVFSLDTDDLNVYIDDVQTTAFTLTGTADSGRYSNATITLTTPILNQTIKIEGDRVIRRDDDIVSGPTFLDTVNRNLDTVVASLQEMFRTVGDSLRFPDGEPASTTRTIPALASRRGKYAFFDAITGAITAVSLTATTVLADSQPDFETRQAVTTTSIPITVTHFRTGGCITRGDLGHALYTRAASEPTHDFKVQSSDGAWWVGNPENGVIREKQIGESGAGSDDTVVLQATHDAALELGVDCLFVGPDLIASSIMHGSTSTTVRPPVIYGVGVGYNGSTSLGASTKITSNTSSLPLIATSGVRRGELKDITLRSNISIDTSTFDASGIEPTTDAYWDGVYGARSVTTPYAGVAFDAYQTVNGSPPGTAYAGKTYVNNAGSGYKCSNVEFFGFPVGFVDQPSGTNNQNGDFMGFEDCYWTVCRDVISIGTSQHRNLDARRCVFNRFQWLVATDLHGAKGGRVGGKFDNCSGGGYCGNLFSVHGLATPAALVFDTCYFESLHRLGDINGNVGDGEGHLSMRDCLLNFRHEADDVHPINILGGFTVAGGSTVVRNRGIKTFDACRFEGIDQFTVLRNPNIIFRNGTYINPSDKSTYATLFTGLLGFVSVDTTAPLDIQEPMFDGQNFQAVPTPTFTNANITIVSTVGRTVTYTGHPAYATYGDGTVVYERLGDGTAMVVTGDGTAELLTNHSGGEIITALASSFSASFIQTS